MYYKFILYITRGAPNKVKGPHKTTEMATNDTEKSVTAGKKGANTVTKTDTDMGLFSIRDPKQKDLKFRQRTNVPLLSQREPQ